MSLSSVRRKTRIFSAYQVDYETPGCLRLRKGRRLWCQAHIVFSIIIWSMQQVIYIYYLKTYYQKKRKNYNNTTKQYNYLTITKAGTYCFVKLEAEPQFWRLSPACRYIQCTNMSALLVAYKNGPSSMLTCLWTSGLLQSCICMIYYQYSLLQPLDTWYYV